MSLNSIFEFHSPTKITFGNNAVKKIGSIAAKYGNKAIIITNTLSLDQTGIIDEVRELLENSLVNVLVFGDVRDDSTSEVADLAAHIAKFGQADFIVAIGGANTQSIAKAAAVVMTNSGEASDYVNGQVLYNPPMTVISIPTVMGSLSEIADGFVLRDKYDNAIKMLRSNLAVAKECIIDPKFYINIPSRFIITNALSIFSASFDSYISKTENKLSETFAFEAMNYVIKNIKLIMTDFTNVEYLNSIALASMYSSIAALNSGLGSIYSISVATNSVSGSDISTIMSILLPYVMEYNMTVATEKYSKIESIFSESDPDMTVLERAIKTSNNIRNCIADLDLPKRLNEIGVQRHDLPEISKLAASYPTMENIPREMEVASIMTILEQAY